LSGRANSYMPIQVMNFELTHIDSNHDFILRHTFTGAPAQVIVRQLGGPIPARGGLFGLGQDCVLGELNEYQCVTGQLVLKDVPFAAAEYEARAIYFAKSQRQIAGVSSDLRSNTIRFRVKESGADK